MESMKFNREISNVVPKQMGYGRICQYSNEDACKSYKNLKANDDIRRIERGI